MGVGQPIGLAASLAVSRGRLEVRTHRTEKEEIVRWLLNSAVIAAGAYGTYKYETATVEDLRAFLRNQEVVAGVPSPDGLLRTLDTGRVVVSRIGYEATAQRIRDWTGRHVPLSRETSAMRPGDVAMVVRLKYRVDPHAKGAHRPDRDGWEIGRLERLK